MIGSLPTKLSIRGQDLVLEALLGAGATSSVYRGCLGRQGRSVAVKVANPGCLSILAAEGKCLLWSASAHLPRLLAVGLLRPRLDERDGDHSCPLQPGGRHADPEANLGALVLEGWDGKPLRELLSRGEGLGSTACLNLAITLGEALADLHSVGLCHGDLKPDNVLVKPQEGLWEIQLIDLGLADTLDATSPRGGTLRYLPPEALRPDSTSDGRSRDLWALGVVLAEVALGEGFDTALDPSRSLVDLPHPVRELVASLMDRIATARPSAEWLSIRAKSLWAKSNRTEFRPVEPECRIRRAYLAARKHEIITLARASSHLIDSDGAGGDWLREAVEQFAGTRELEGLAPEMGEARANKMDSSGWARLLANLVGPSAARWPLPVIESEEVWLERLMAASRATEPRFITLAALGEGVGESPRGLATTTLVDIALALGEKDVKEELLHQAESLVLDGSTNDRFVLTLGRRLRAKGELGRAYRVFSRASAPEGMAEAAETARRMGSVELTEQWLSQVLSISSLDGRARARALATRARILLDQGQPESALACLEDTVNTAATCEVRALALHLSGQSARACEAVQQGRALATSDEDLARLEGSLGLILHRLGKAEQSILAFRLAVDEAARAGAVLEEGIYLTGWSAAAVDAGRMAEAITAAERAMALFEVLRRPREAARAALNRISALVDTGRTSDALWAKDQAISLAQEANDEICLAFLYLALADALPLGTEEARANCRRARSLLDGSSVNDRLRLAARELDHGLSSEVGSWDEAACGSEVTTVARVEWWGARARRANAELNSQESSSIVAELAKLADAPAPPVTRGKAMAAGVRLARLAGMGEFARRLHVAAAEDAQRILGHAPSEMLASLRALSWVVTVRTSFDATLLPEQIPDIEHLVRALGERESLRVLSEQILDALVLWTGVERGLLLLRAPGGRLVPRAGRNLARGALVGQQRELSYTLANRALERGEPTVAVDAAHDIASIHESIHALKLRSVLAVPLMAHGEGLGVVYLDDRVRRGAFGAKELAWVRVVAAIAAVAIAEARDRLQLRRAVRRAERAEHRMSEMLAAREAELGEVRVELARKSDQRPTRYRYQEIVGESAAMRELLRLVDRVIPSSVPVLIVGESGSGKELVARAIHRNGPRAREAFVAENCGAIPETLLESALFGHVRGAFTGASRSRAGLFEVADRGTLFLDEMGEMSLAMQTKLLRVLEDGEIRPVGSERLRRVDVRVIAATNRDLEAMVRDGRFRQDLFYRLNVVTLRIPPLRERHGDIPLLARHLVEKCAQGRAVVLTPMAMERLARYSWPGNVRQLENEIRRALVLADGEITLEHLSEETLERTTESPAPREPGALRDRVDRLEYDLVISALERTGGNQTRAAEMLGLSRFGLQKKMRRLEIVASGSGRAPKSGLFGAK